MKRILFLAIIYALTFCYDNTSNALGGEHISPSEQKSILTELEELSAQLHKDGSYVDVSGAIRNISNSTLKGFVTVYLLDEKGKVVSAKDETVARGTEFSKGAVVKFEVTLEIPKKKNIESISVDFTKE